MAKRKAKTMRRAARRVKSKVSKMTKRRKSGKTKGKKKKRKQTAWQKHVAATYKVMKAENPSIKGIGPVLKAASKSWKKRPLSMSVD